MKIEIAESLVSSYLKHNQGCRIVQTNWKTSGNWNVTEYDDKQARDLFEVFNNSPDFEGLFKQSSFDQLIKQAEIDVLGVNSTENSIFGIDVAFHTSGLNYGEKKKTGLAIVKKILRTVFIMQSYFSHLDKYNSFFVTPKVNPATEKEILSLMSKAKELISDEMINIEFIANDDFYEQIVDPIIESVENENDTSELFARSLKLMQLDPRNKKSKDIKTPKNQVNGMKIGQFVQFQFRKLHDDGFITEKEISLLQDKEYSKKVFDQNYEIFRNSKSDIKSPDGRTRYYSRELFCGDYYLTSQWTDRHWDKLLAWIEGLK